MNKNIVYEVLENGLNNHINEIWTAISEEYGIPHEDYGGWSEEPFWTEIRERKYFFPE